MGIARPGYQPVHLWSVCRTGPSCDLENENSQDLAFSFEEDSIRSDSQTVKVLLRLDLFDIANG